MKATVEKRGGVYLIRIYGSDGLPCDAYVVEDILFEEEGINIKRCGNARQCQQLEGGRNEG